MTDFGAEVPATAMVNDNLLRRGPRRIGLLPRLIVAAEPLLGKLPDSVEPRLRLTETNGTSKLRVTLKNGLASKTWQEQRETC